MRQRIDFGTILVEATRLVEESKLIAYTLYMIKKFIIMLLLSFLICSSASSSVFIITAGGVDFNDLADSKNPQVIKMLNSGSLALVNLRSGRINEQMIIPQLPKMEAALLSVGASSLASGGIEASLAAQTKNDDFFPDALTDYETRTGVNINNKQIIHPEISRIKNINSSASYDAIPGLLGKTIHENDQKTAIVGSSDTPYMPHREAVVIAMDEYGTIDYGMLNYTELTNKSSESAFGIKTNIALMITKALDYSKKSSLVVLDFGDTFRADEYSILCLENQAKKIRNTAISNLGTLFVSLKSVAKKNDTIILLIPSTYTYSLQQSHLGTIIISNPKFNNGLLLSSSTKKPGVITLSDIAPTILNELKIKPPIQMLGRPIKQINKTQPIQYLKELSITSANQASRQILMRITCIVQIAIVLIVSLLIFIWKRTENKKISAFMSLFCAAIVPATLLLPLIYKGGLIISAIILLLLAIIILIIVKSINKKLFDQLGLLSLSAVLLIAGDLLTGSHLLSLSIAGYSLSEGARYYGVGNELMGSLIGASFICALWLLYKKPIYRILVYICLWLIFMLIGSPVIGANVGGALACASAIIVFMLILSGKNLQFRHAIYLIFGVVFAISIIFAIDSFRATSGQSHAGRLINQIKAGNIIDVFQTFERKIALNFMLVGSSLWSRLLGISIISSFIAYFKVRPNLNRIQMSCISGITAGTITAFAFNDSGVVAAATCIVYLWMLLVVILVDLRNG